MRFTNKNVSRKAAAIAVATALTVFGGAGAAIAYWTTTGSGTGSTTVSSANGTVVLHGTIGSGVLAPGTSRSVTFTADNAGASDLRVRTIKLDSINVDSAHSSCVVTDFSMADVASDTTVVHGSSGQAVAGTGTLAFANDLVNSQDGCKGATLTLNLSSN